MKVAEFVHDRVLRALPIWLANLDCWQRELDVAVVAVVMPVIIMVLVMN